MVLGFRVSNCAVNLSPDKAAVLAGAWRALAPGGEMHFADVYADRRLSEVRRLSCASSPAGLVARPACSGRSSGTLPLCKHAASGALHSRASGSWPLRQGLLDLGSAPA